MGTPNKIFDGLNTQQEQIVRQLKGVHLITAPIGTGKTKVLAHRAAYAIEQAINPAQMLCLSFTNKAAREMGDRITAMAGPGGGKISISTFHGFCANILREESKQIGLNPDFSIFDEKDRDEVLQLILKRAGGNVFPVKSMMENFCDFKKYFYGLKPRNQEYNSTAALMNEYHAYLTENNALDFDDLILLVFKHFTEDDTMLRRWQRRFSFIQVDEFQDTNADEYIILLNLALEHGNIAFFGDIDQTIYEWRGSVPYAILADLKKQFPGLTEHYLLRNYRCSETILEASHALISKYGRARTKKLQCCTDVKGEKVIIHRAQNTLAEAEWIAREIQSLRNDETKNKGKIAVLSRTNAEAVRVSNALANLKIPHLKVDTDKFFRRTESKDMLAHLKTLVNPYDTLSLARVLKNPPKGIGEATVHAFQSLPKQTGISIADLVHGNANPADDPFLPLFEAFDSNRLVIFDTETTGLDFGTDEIIEIAAIRCGKDGIMDEFHRLLKPSKPVGESYSVHGHSDAKLAASGADPAAALRSFTEFVSGSVLLGHNLAFDLSMLKSSCIRHSVGFIPREPYFDSLDLARKAVKLISYKLSALAEHYRLSHKPSHQAMDDVLATFELTCILIAVFKSTSRERTQFLRLMYPKFHALRSQLSELKQLLEVKRPAEIIREIMKRFDFPSYISKLSNPHERMSTLEELAVLFEKYDNPGLPADQSLRNLIQLSMLGDETRYLKDRNDVLVLTVHQAKGLEFETVFIMGAAEDSFPSYFSKKLGKVDEEHRLFYVAMTRAKNSLYITRPEFDARGYKKQDSRFIAMLPPHLIENR